MKRLHERGEIATVITIGSLIILGVTTLVSSTFINKTKQTTGSKAACAGCETNGKCYAVGSTVSGGYCCFGPKQGERCYNYNHLDKCGTSCAAPTPPPTKIPSSAPTSGPTKTPTPTPRPGGDISGYEGCAKCCVKDIKCNAPADGNGNKCGYSQLRIRWHSYDCTGNNCSTINVSGQQVIQCSDMGPNNKLRCENSSCPSGYYGGASNPTTAPNNPTPGGQNPTPITTPLPSGQRCLESNKTSCSTYCTNIVGESTNSGYSYYDGGGGNYYKADGSCSLISGGLGAYCNCQTKCDPVNMYCNVFCQNEGYVYSNTNSIKTDGGNYYYNNGKCFKTADKEYIKTHCGCSTSNPYSPTPSAVCGSNPIACTTYCQNYVGESTNSGASYYDGGNDKYYKNDGACTYIGGQTELSSHCLCSSRCSSQTNGCDEFCTNNAGTTFSNGKRYDQSGGTYYYKNENNRCLQTTDKEYMKTYCGCSTQNPSFTAIGDTVTQAETTSEVVNVISLPNGKKCQMLQGGNTCLVISL